MTTPRICAVVPTYDNPRTIAAVVERVRAYLADVIVVDDGSGPEAAAVLDALAREGRAHVRRRPRNGGKGAAVKDGLRAARELGFTHALQLDADGQHRPEDIDRFLAACRERPEALVLGRPVFDASAPAVRSRARHFTRLWTDLETGGRVIEDALCGFRVYPVEAALRAGARGDRMDFDVEIAVRMVWLGCPVVTLPTQVRYLTAAEGGVSHFRMFRDNVLMSWCHTRLCTLAVLRLLTGRPLGPR